MRRSDKTWTDMDEFTKPFLPDESVESSMAVAIELRAKLTKLEQQVLAQYTAMAAYAAIGQQNVEEARAECRADLDRSQATMIGLIEKLRNEMTARFNGVDVRSAPSTSLSLDAGTRLAAMEHKVAAMAALLDQSARENTTLRAQLNGLVQQRMHDDGWLVSNGTPEALSLR